MTTQAERDFDNAVLLALSKARRMIRALYGIETRKPRLSPERIAALEEYYAFIEAAGGTPGGVITELSFYLDGWRRENLPGDLALDLHDLARDRFRRALVDVETERSVFLHQRQAARKYPSRATRLDLLADLLALLREAADHERFRGGRAAEWLADAVAALVEMAPELANR